MSRQRYHAKRRFERTPEPRDSVAPSSTDGRLRFVVQKHEATTLHYDLRLEQDHPIEYGAGHVELWDEGTWIPEEAPLPAYRRGRLKFEIKGRRLTGHWALVRMGNAQTRKKDLWLLMKLEDEPRVSSARPMRRRAAGSEGDARR